MLSRGCHPSLPPVATGLLECLQLPEVLGRGIPHRSAQPPVPLLSSWAFPTSSRASSSRPPRGLTLLGGFLRMSEACDSAEFASVRFLTEPESAGLWVVPRALTHLRRRRRARWG